MDKVKVKVGDTVLLNDGWGFNIYLKKILSISKTTVAVEYYPRCRLYNLKTFMPDKYARIKQIDNDIKRLKTEKRQIWENLPDVEI